MRNEIALTLLTLCIATGATAEEPDWLREARVREGELLSPKKVRSSDGFFRAQVPAKVAGKIVPDEGTYLVRMDANTGAPVECLVVRQNQDLASFLVATSKGADQAIEAAGGKVAAKALERVDAGAIGTSPFLAVDWTYRIEPESQPAIVGMLKQVAASKDGHTIYCVHNEVGYVQTFRRLAGAMIESTVFKDAPRTRPYRSEIATLTLQGMRVGVSELTFTRDADGDTRIQNTTSMLVPADAQTLVANDEVMIQWAKPDGSLINAFQVENDNGEIGSELKLNPQDDGSWSVTGTFKSKPLAATIPAAKPSTMLGDVMLLRAKLAESNPVGGVMKVQSWLPGVDPSKLLDQELAIVRAVGDDHFAARVELAGIVADLVVERDGSTVSGTLTMGPMKLEVERVFADGSI